MGLIVISRMFRQDPVVRTVARLYVQLVEQSRQPEFFLRCGIPDSLDGRFDMLVLHAFLVLERLNGAGEREAEIAQALIDHLFADLDVNLREMGVGDLSVGKKVKQMVRAFYGREQAYRAGLAADDETSLTEALHRNLFRSADPTQSQLEAMVAYVRREQSALVATPIDDLLNARHRFGRPPVPAETLAES